MTRTERRPARTLSRMTGLRNGPPWVGMAHSCENAVAYLEAQLEYESVSLRPEESTTLIQGSGGISKRAPHRRRREIRLWRWGRGYRVCLASPLRVPGHPMHGGEKRWAG
jgi:hypothetical protein